MTVDGTLIAATATDIAPVAGTRTIQGVCLVFGAVGASSAGKTRFMAGSLRLPTDLSRVKLLLDHDATDPLGYLSSATIDAESMTGEFTVAAGDRGDMALAQATDKRRDGLSVGCQIEDWSMEGDVVVIKAATLTEVSLVSIPAFADARITQVRAHQKGRIVTSEDLTVEQPEQQPEQPQQPAPEQPEQPEQPKPEQQPAPAALPVWHYLRLHSPPGGVNAQATLTDLLQQLGLQDKLTRPLAQLSGGEWQRVRLAAVVLQIHPAINPRGALLILDEPLTALDIAQQREVDKLLLQLSEAGIAIVASGHDLNHSLRHADRVWLMHQGRVVSQGRAREVLTAERLEPLYQAEFVQLETPQGPLLYLP